MVGGWTKRWYAWLREEAELSDSDRWLLEQHLDLIVYLEGQIAAAEARIEAAVADDPVVTKLQSLYGVGLITAVTLRAEVGRFDRFDST